MRDFSNFGSLKSTETYKPARTRRVASNFSNFGSLKSTETREDDDGRCCERANFSNFGSLKSTETEFTQRDVIRNDVFQQFRLVEEH